MILGKPKKKAVSPQWSRLTAIGRVKGAAVLIDKLSYHKELRPSEIETLQRIRLDLDCLAAKMKEV